MNRLPPYFILQDELKLLQFCLSSKKQEVVRPPLISTGEIDKKKQKKRGRPRKQTKGLNAKIFQLSWEGVTQKEIANRVGVSERTVRRMLRG